MSGFFVPIFDAVLKSPQRYEMYAGESKAASSPANDINSPDNLQPLQSDVLPNSESRPALEVIELANGETIWSVIFLSFAETTLKRNPGLLSMGCEMTKRNPCIRAELALHPSTRHTRPMVMVYKFLSRNLEEQTQKVAIHLSFLERSPSKESLGPRQR